MFNTLTVTTRLNGNDIAHRSHAQPQSDVGWVGMGLWPVHVGAPTTSRKPLSGVGNGR
ncbi:MAG: hypothetical protein ACFCUH_06945 [Flavobacteriales bacterium]